MKRFARTSAVFAMMFAAPALGQDTGPAPATLIANVRIFDGVDAALIENASVLVEGAHIAAVSTDEIEAEGATIIDGGGRVLMPGIIGCHEHVMMQLPISTLLNSDERYIAAVATATAETYLMSGWTSIRDAAGNTFGLKKAIDQGFVVGPRIYPSGPMITQTSGHSDHRTFQKPLTAATHGVPTTGLEYFDLALADGVPEVLKAVREAMRMGATQIKIAVGGGTGSYADPLDVVQYRDDEIRAAVDAASDYNTYVMAHVYNDKGAQRAMNAGVRSIEHGNLLSEETVRMMKDKDVWWCPQVITYTEIPKGYTDDQADKHRQAYDGIDSAFKAAKTIGYEKIGFGTDIITDPALIARMNDEFTLRTNWFSNLEILRQATSRNGEILGLSHRYSPGRIGVIEEGALADILLVDGNPLEDLSILTDPEANLDLIMKNGVIYKNALTR
ncbi:metal-dependent hydrolase family protein [Albimonas pacifica]|uniref:Imidazolonepropionase n=1 Tax=Albimonas pacifica TaxID=1114924 RepID=A0A1I3BQ98_9RHOB|nr:amidohydrolase family protein [Albimonas pacifica]SFH64437.1 Imidazolonepropionase [Albimonas pacifica]